MCKLCSEKPVYEFTNKRKLCKTCFITYFHKKVLYTIRKFKMIKPGDEINFSKDNSFKGVVLKEILDFISSKIDINLNSNEKGKVALSSSLDSEADGIVKTLIKGDVSELKKFLPVSGNEIKPLYLFLDEEILLYAKLRKLKFTMKKEKKGEIEKFEDEFEKKHPEVKRAIINGVLELYE